MGSIQLPLNPSTILDAGLNWAHWAWAAGLGITIILAIWSVFKLIEKIVRG